jgi:hypothetical protein
MITTAQTSADQSWHELSSLSLRHSLLLTIDAACADMAGGKWLTEELASRVGLSIRTLRNAVQRYRGNEFP